MTDGSNYTLSKFEDGTTLGEVIDMLKRRAVIQRGSAVQRNELMGTLSLSERSLAMLSGPVGPGEALLQKL